MKCYSAAKKLVEAGKTTWEELAHLKLAESRDERTPLEKELEKRRQDAGDSDIPF